MGIHQKITSTYSCDHPDCHETATVTIEDGEPHSIAHGFESLTIDSDRDGQPRYGIFCITHAQTWKTQVAAFGFRKPGEVQ